MTLNFSRSALLKTRRKALAENRGVDNDAMSGCSTEEMNDLLTYLLEIYPDRDAGACRQALLAASMECKLEEAAAHLADHPASEESDVERGAGDKLLEPWQRFRTHSYKAAVAKALKREFSVLKGSSIRAVLAENNYDYARSRECMSKITARSWRRSILSILPLRRSKTNVLCNTGCFELDAEIDSVHNGRNRIAQLDSDVRLARHLNETQYDALFECECCFTDVAWEDICFCTDFHYFCRQCLRRSVEEGLYGQGSCFDSQRASVRCISSAAEPQCTNSVPSALLPNFLPSEVITAIDDHFATAAIDRSNKSTLTCPFCPYAVEIVESSSLLLVPSPMVECPLRSAFYDFWRWLSTNQLPFAGQQGPQYAERAFAHPMHRHPAHLMQHVPARPVRREYALLTHPTPHEPAGPSTLAERHNLQDWETIFRCKNPRCLRTSCLKCGREWLGIHDCANDDDNKRTFIERRLDEAIKRICPRCNTAFVKEGGCNKMTCSVCGHKMCYLCRADVRDKLYKHFCSHFRAVPGTACKSCTLCSLFQDEVEDEIIQATRAAAEEEWERRQRAKYSGARYVARG